MAALKKNRVRVATFVMLALLLAAAVRGMEAEDWFITILRGLSTGMLVFLVAAGLSLIFGLMDVLNLAHGELFMLGAYVGWTVFVRPDTFIDLLPLLLLLAAGFVLLPAWRVLLARRAWSVRVWRIWPWLALVVGLAAMWLAVSSYPFAIWDPNVYADSPITYSLALSQGTLALSQGTLALPASEAAIGAALLALAGALVSSGMVGLALAGFGMQRQPGTMGGAIPRRVVITAVALTLVALVTFFLNDALTTFLFAISTTWRFFAAMGVALGLGFALGAMVEVTLIRPLYERPIYQLMVTLGLGFILIESVQAVWGRPEFTMPKPALFDGAGGACPATTLGDWLTNQCATVILFDGRVRAYNELFIILMGLVVLVMTWLVLQRTRIGMIIRAGVQDSEMVEALGINVRQVFTFVFALGVALASLGGILAAPATGLSTGMGTRFLLLALIALAIGGLTSFPGAAVGSILVGLLQQFIIKYGQIGINLPFLAEPFKPSPPLVPASVVLLMVIILLVLPGGLLGRTSD